MQVSEVNPERKTKEPGACTAFGTWEGPTPDQEINSTEGW